MISIVLLTHKRYQHNTETSVHDGHFHDVECDDDQAAWILDQLQELCGKLSSSFQLRRHGNRIQVTGESKEIELLNRSQDLAFILRKAKRAKHTPQPKKGHTGS